MHLDLLEHVLEVEILSAISIYVTHVVVSISHDQEKKMIETINNLE